MLVSGLILRNFQTWKQSLRWGQRLGPLTAPCIPCCFPWGEDHMEGAIPSNCLPHWPPVHVSLWVCDPLSCSWALLFIETAPVVSSPGCRSEVTMSLLFSGSPRWSPNPSCQLICLTSLLSPGPRWTFPSSLAWPSSFKVPCGRLCYVSLPSMF